MKYRMKSMAAIALVSALVLFAVSVAPAMAQLTPPTPYVINGYVFYENETACNGSIVNVTNVNTGEEWEADNSSTSDYYRLVLCNGTDVNASETLGFNAKDPAETQFNVTEHTITQPELNDGGLINFNLTLHPPPAPDLKITNVWFEVGDHCNWIKYNITNNGDAEAGRSVSNLTVDGNVTKKRDGVKPLAIRESRTESFRYSKRLGTPDTIMVCADFKNRIAESNETNNCYP